MHEFYSHGKLLITSEYAVLDGAKALALPTKHGQLLRVSQTDRDNFEWRSYDQKGKLWFSGLFNVTGSHFTAIESSNDTIAKKLIEIVSEAVRLSKEEFDFSGYSVTTHLEFNRHWGLGSSSTLVNNIAQWLHINAFELQEKTFGGSGYDIACAQNPHPIVYQNKGGSPVFESANIKWPFKEHLYFIYLNKKQNSRVGITNYRSKKKLQYHHIDELNEITMAIINTSSMARFQQLIKTHNNIIKHLIEMTPASESLFKDFKGSIKNLGAWGGDFILACSEEDPGYYFRNKGYETIVPFNEMIL
jgi:mevalonate kinase